jgi:hypothetical protein
MKRNATESAGREHGGEQEVWTYTRFFKYTATDWARHMNRHEMRKFYILYSPHVIFALKKKFTEISLKINV